MIALHKENIPNMIIDTNVVVNVDLNENNVDIFVDPPTIIKITPKTSSNMINMTSVI